MLSIKYISDKHGYMFVLKGYNNKIEIHGREQKYAKKKKNPENDRFRVLNLTNKL